MGMKKWESFFERNFTLILVAFIIIVNAIVQFLLSLL